jgi:UDP-2,3-diacylglucosamine hydrolase
LTRMTFISDLHLPPTPGTVGAHLESLTRELAARQSSGQAQQLYVLGDLFSFWVDRPLVAELFSLPLKAIAELVRSGCRVVILQGNRDFGFGRVIVDATGAEFPGESCAIEQVDSRALLLHGDQLLTFDRRYQLFKKVVRSWPARMAARWFPSPLLLWSVRRLERVSTAENTRKTSAQMRVDDQVAEREMNKTSANVLIHGHTHEHGSRQIAGSEGELALFNLGEWDENGGTILDWPEGASPRLVHWPPPEPQG